MLRAVAAVTPFFRMGVLFGLSCLLSGCRGKRALLLSSGVEISVVLKGVSTLVTACQMREGSNEGSQSSPCCFFNLAIYLSCR